MDHGFGHWLAGFIDGEGCFLITPARGRNRNWSCEFRLALRDDDERILNEIVLATGLGCITRQGPWRNSHPRAVWHVRTKAHCVGLVDVLDEHPLRAKKARDYAIWRGAVVWWVASGDRRSVKGRPRGTATRDWTVIEDLAAQLKAGRTYRWSSEAGAVPIVPPFMQLAMAAEDPRDSR